MEEKEENNKKRENDSPKGKTKMYLPHDFEYT